METTNKDELRTERAALVAVVRDRQEDVRSEEYLDDLEFLAGTADLATVKTYHTNPP